MLNWMYDSLIRRKARLEATPLDRYVVRVARSAEEYEDAFRLLHIAYAFQGIEGVRGADMRITPQHVLPESTVLVAYEGSMLVGTMTVTLDSPVGLPLEKDYPDEIAALRLDEAKIVEYGSLAVVRRCWHTGVTTLLNMAAYRFARYVLGATHTVAGMHPKAAPYYRAVYGFSPMGKPKQHAELRAPVIGVMQDMLGAQDFFRRTYKKPMSTGLLPLEHFVSRPPPCIELPEQIPPEELPRWKLSREVFQEIFMRRSDRIDSLDPATRSYLARRRSRMTLRLGTTPLGQPMVRTAGMRAWLSSH